LSEFTFQVAIRTDRYGSDAPAPAPATPPARPHPRTQTPTPRARFSIWPIKRRPSWPSGRGTPGAFPVNLDNHEYGD